MKKKYKLIYSPLFYNDLENIVNYIECKLQNRIAANNFLDEVENKIKERSFSPEAYKEYKSRKNRKYKYYRIYVNNYTIFYIVKDDLIEIKRILFSRRNFDKFI